MVVNEEPKLNIDFTNNTNCNNTKESLEIVNSIKQLELSKDHSIAKKNSINNESETESEIDVHSIYTSRLPEPQPLYQYYMQQEQERLLNEHGKFLVPLDKVKQLDNNIYHSTEPTISEIEPVKQNLINTLSSPILEDSVDTLKNNLNDLKADENNGAKETNVVKFNNSEENEVDSVCDSNEPNDAENILVGK